MTQPKASLAEMAELADEQAEHVEGMLAHRHKHLPDQPPDTLRERQVFVWRSLAHLLRILGTFEERSRTFVAGLVKEHERG